MLRSTSNKWLHSHSSELLMPYIWILLRPTSWIQSHLPFVPNSSSTYQETSPADVQDQANSTDQHLFNMQWIVTASDQLLGANAVVFFFFKGTRRLYLGNIHIWGHVDNDNTVQGFEFGWVSMYSLVFHFNTRWNVSCKMLCYQRGTTKQALCLRPCASTLFDRRCFCY